MLIDSRGSLPRLRTSCSGNPMRMRERRAEDEAARLDREYAVGAQARDALRERVDRSAKRRRVARAAA